MNLTTYAAAAGSRGTIQPEQRSPLVFPPCHSCPSPWSYDKTLPGPIPLDPRYLVANCWGIPIAGLPWVPGITSSKHPERFLSYIFANYPRWAQEQWFDENQKRAYSTVVFSWPNARAQAGQSLGEFRADCQRAKDRGFRVQVKLWSKDFDPHDMSFDTWRGFADTIFAALDGVADEFAPWEYDSGNLSDDTAIRVHRYLGQQAHAQGAAFFCHFYPGHGYWWDGHNEAEWYRELGADVDGLDLQTDPASDIGDTQARIVDHLRNVCPSGRLVRAFEPGIPSLMFDGDEPDENAGDAWGYLCCCTRGAGQVYGCGSGIRMPDGSPFR